MSTLTFMPYSKFQSAVIKVVVIGCSGSCAGAWFWSRPDPLLMMTSLIIIWVTGMIAVSANFLYEVTNMERL